MVLNDPISDALSTINNAVKALIPVVTLKKSKLLLQLLKLLKENNYVGDYETIEDGNQGLIKVNLLSTINECGAIKPRYPVQLSNLQRYEKQFLPAQDFGIIILSTNKGLLTHQVAKKLNVGGTLIAYCY